MAVESLLAVRPSRPFLWRLAVVALVLVAMARVPWVLTLPSLAPVARVELPSAANPDADLPLPDIPLPALPAPDALIALPSAAAQASNAAVPFASIDAVAPSYRAPADANPRDRAADCLAAAAWYEAGDMAQGERAVIQVVLNRVRHPAFAKSVCGVVFQGAPDAVTNGGAGSAGGCQFTFACDGSIARRQPTAPAWARARAIALAALGGAVDRDVGIATHYHADYVVPRWRDEMAKLAKVGPHLFYRWQGFWGTAGALRNPPTSAEPRVAILARLSPAHATDRHDAAPVAFAQLAEDETVTAPQAAHSAPATAPRSDAEHFALSLDPGAFSGSYAVRAFGLCKDHPRCLVVGRVDTNPAPAFLFLRDARRGVETALWNCTLTPRADPGQCLPDAAGIARLTAGW